MKFAAVIAMAIVAWGSVCASEPGEPWDCSDWTIYDSTLSCSVAIAPPCGSRGACAGNSQVVDNEGTIIYQYGSQSDYIDTCGCADVFQCPVTRIRVYRWVSGAEEVLAELRGRCIDPETRVAQNPERYGMLFHEEDGRLLVNVVDPYRSESMQFALGPFTTTFEIFQSYDPPVAELSFRVPYMPEGLDAADYFDTYWGNLATVGDWSQAHGLQCGFPTISPEVGDYLTVPDTLPTPQPGNGYYYVTAVNYAGVRRYGRKASGGQLSGRDPTILPACE